jgi:hypothetical protein
MLSRVRNTIEIREVSLLEKLNFHRNQNVQTTFNIDRPSRYVLFVRNHPLQIEYWNDFNNMKYGTGEFIDTGIFQWLEHISLLGKLRQSRYSIEFLDESAHINVILTGDEGPREIYQYMWLFNKFTLAIQISSSPACNSSLAITFSLCLHLKEGFHLANTLEPYNEQSEIGCASMNSTVNLGINENDSEAVDNPVINSFTRSSSYLRWSSFKMI